MSGLREDDCEERMMTRVEFRFRQEVINHYWSACLTCSNNIKPEREDMCDKCEMTEGSTPTQWIKRVQRPTWKPRKIRC